MTTRDASHAGSWYTSNPRELSSQLDAWLDAVPLKTQCIGSKSKDEVVDIPCRRARAVIAPHAGFAYSGPAAAWAYKAVDWKRAKRVFLLGPSHHYYLSGAALSKCKYYATPLGNLRLDLDTISDLYETGAFEKMSLSNDEAEHSLEMHLPYIYKMLSRHFHDEREFPPLIPILVGSTSQTTERRYGALLSPYLADPSSIFIVSSDFCHWGSRFRYTYYQPANHNAPAYSLRSGDKVPGDWPIHQSIALVDKMCMDACETGDYGDWCKVLEETGNTVCGRHPIGVVMAAVEALEERGELNGQCEGNEADDELEEGNGQTKGQTKGRFRFVRYERSSRVASVRDSSVSYCSAFAVF